MSIGAERIDVKDERCRGSLSPSVRSFAFSLKAAVLRRVRATIRRMAGASAGSVRNAAMTTARSASARQPSADHSNSSSAVRCMGGQVIEDEEEEEEEDEPPRYSEVSKKISA